MTTVHEAAKLTVSTESGISRSATNHLGVLEVSGPGMDHVTSQDVSFLLSSANVPQLSLGATDNSGIFQLGVDKNGNSILESTHNGQNQNILIQQLGGYVGVGTNVPASTFHIHSTDALIIPVGTTSERPGEGSNIIASNGMIRYNTTTSQFEGYGPGSSWGSLGGVKDVDSDTYIRAETYPDAGNNDLQFFTAGEERMVINSVGDISMNGDITTSKGYPYYQSLGTEKIVTPPSTALTVHGVNVTAMNKRTRASYASAEACVSTWTARSAASDSASWSSVCWSSELSIFVAVAVSGGNRAMTSPDGGTWTARSASNANGWFSVCWSPEFSLFVAVAIFGTNRVMTSPNGINWTARSESEANAWCSVCWSPELSLFVAVSYTGTNRVMTSPDGITWTSRSVASNSWYSVCWSPELSLFVAVANYGTYRVMTSLDGITWTSRSSASESTSWSSVCWSPELSLFVAVGTNRAMTSPDGITWTARSVASNAWSSVCWSPELSLFVAVAVNGTNRVMSSPDGITWTSRLSATESNAWRSVCWSPELSIFVAVEDYGTNRVMTSNIGMPNSKSVVKALPTQMSVLPNGNVGIGTDNPTDKLEIRNNHSQLRLTDSDNNSYAQLSLSSSMLAIRIDSTNSTSDLYIKSGKVGIGTTDPGTALHVHGKTYITNGGQLASPSTGTYGSNGARIVLWPGSSTGYAYAIGMASNTMWFGIPDGQRFSFFGGTHERVRIEAGGNVGIGTTNPSGPLHVYYKESADPTNNIKDMLILHTEYSSDFGGSYREGGCSIMFYAHNSSQATPGESARIVSGCYETSSSTEYHSYLAFHTSNNSSGAGTNERMIIDDNGYVGIGVSRPSAPLCIKYATNGNHDYGDSGNFRSGYYMRSYPRNGGASGAVYWYTDTWFSYELSILAEGGIYAKIGYIMASDERIKENITDVPDDIALEMLRKIPCRYYEYKDKYRRGTDKTIGFIAQEVKEVMPMAVSQQTDFIPNEMRPLEDVHWNNTTLYSDISDASGVSYKFFVSNDISGSDEQEINIIGNSDNSFTFEKSWNYVYCYGKQVDDFNAISKDKLFALNFSATQEIDKIQREEASKLTEQTSRIDTLNTKIANLEEENSLLSNTCDNLSLKVLNMDKEISTLSKTNNNLSLKVLNLEEENSLLSNTCDNLSLKVLNMDKEISTLSKTNNNLSLKVLNLEQQITNILSIISSS
jgi:hypothetical protein